MNTKNIFTFWEGKMPAYIKLCMDSWKVPFTVLNYDNLHNYTDLQINESLKRFTLPQIADCVRVHVLRDQGGYWLDADTIMITDRLPETNMVGNPISRTNTIGMLYTEKNSDMYIDWAKYQDKFISSPNAPTQWSVFGNDFTDRYVLEHEDITISSVHSCWPENYMVNGENRYEKYRKFYFENSFHLSDILQTDMLMLHNSWTPDWYKEFSKEEVLSTNCTMSNILKEVLCNI